MKAKPFFVLLALWIPLLLPEETRAAQLEIVLAAPTLPATSLGSAVLQNLDRPDLQPSAVEISAPGLLEVDTSGGKRWSLRLESAEHWAAELQLDGSATATQPWVLHPIVRYRISRSRTTPLPADVFASFVGLRKPGFAESPLAGRVRCEGDVQLRTCALPAVPLDLKIEAAGFAPSFFWNLSAKAGSQHDLGVVTLLSGASIAGRIVDGDGEPLIATLEAVPSVVLNRAAPDPETETRLSMKAIRAQSDERGYFQLVGIAPGDVEIHASASGFITSVLLRDIQLSPGAAELLRDPLVFLKPERLRIKILPKQDPWGRPWVVRLQAPATERIEPQMSPADAEGSWISSPSPPGSYALRIVDEDGQPWDDRDVVLESGGEALMIDISILAVRGRVSQTTEPASGVLLLQQNPSVRGIEFPLEDGKLDGFLPHEGRWLASLKKDGFHSAPIAVEIRKRPGKSYAEVDLRIPDTRLHGDVVDPEGKKVPKALVSYYSLVTKAMGTIETDAEGAFEIAGVEPGQVNLSAQKDDRQSQGLAVVVQEGIQDPEPHRLVLYELKVIEGLILHSGSPRGGARIVAWPDFGSTSLASVLNRSSGPDGAFRLEAPAFAPHITVFAESGGSRRLLQHPVRGSERLILEMDVDSGEIIVDLSPLIAERGSQPMNDVTLIRDGIALPRLLWPFLLRTPPTAGPEPQSLGLFESGNYSLCVGLKTQEDLGPACTSGFLQPNGTLRLVAPAMLLGDIRRTQ